MIFKNYRKAWLPFMQKTSFAMKQLFFRWHLQNARRQTSPSQHSCVSCIVRGRRSFLAVSNNKNNVCLFFPAKLQRLPFAQTNWGSLQIRRLLTVNEAPKDWQGGLKIKYNITMATDDTRYLLKIILLEANFLIKDSFVRSKIIKGEV